MFIRFFFPFYLVSSVQISKEYEEKGVITLPRSTKKHIVYFAPRVPPRGELKIRQDAAPDRYFLFSCYLPVIGILYLNILFFAREGEYYFIFVHG